MLSLRPIRRFCHVAASASASAIASKDCSSAVSDNNEVFNLKDLEEPALVKLKAERDPDKLFYLFKANADNRIVVENRFAFEDTVARLAGARRFDYIEHLLEHQKTLPQGRREGFVVRIIMLYGKAGMIQNAVDTFYDMHFYGCRRTVKSFNAALRVLMQCRDLQAVEDFVREVPSKFDIQLDIFSVNIVVKAFCDAGSLDKAYLIMVEMGKMGITPDVITYTTLMSAFYKHNRCEIGNGLWNLMVLRGCFPNLATFNVRIHYLVCKRRAWEANRVMRLMPSLGIEPDEVTYNLVIKGFCLAGYLDMAQKIYSALHGRGYKPNAKIYQTMIHYLCKEGDFNLAYTMCKDSMQKNWFPSVNTIHKLVEGLKTNGRLGKAKAIMALARKRVPPFPSNKLHALESTLYKR